MRAVRTLYLVAAIALATAQSPTDGINNVIDTPSARLDPYIRKALLKALSELEQNDAQITGTDNNSTELLQTSERVTETLPGTNQSIQIHSFIVNGQSAFANSTDTTPALVDSKISIISTTAGNVENQISDTLPTQTPYNEIFQTRESGINVQQVRSISSTSKFNDNGLQFTNTVPVRASLSSSSSSSTSTTTSIRPSTTTSTTTTTTTTTTPRPTHNEDGENIEEVDKRDVQVFPAPLVAAFTVQQDAQGLPKKVIPIYQQANGQDPKTQVQALVAPSAAPVVPSIASVPPNILPPQSLPQSSPNVVPQNDFIRQQLALQKQLEEKQRILEEQLRFLQIQQRQQEELLRKQQFFLQQKEAQRQQQIFYEQQNLKSQFHPQFQRSPSQGPNNFQQPPLQNGALPNQNNVPQSQNNVAHNQNQAAFSTQVSILQSVPLEQGVNIANQQQLPNREAVDFLLHLRNQRPEQFPLQENHIPQGIASFLQPAPVQNNNQFSNFNQLRPEDQFRPKQANRVFRQENGVGNFGLNQNFNRFQPFQPAIAPNRQFQINRPQFSAADTELKHLLVQNGLNGRSQEDLNIVSKVLALNHGVGLNNNLSNRLPFDNRRPFRPF